MSEPVAVLLLSPPQGPVARIARRAFAGLDDEFRLRRVSNPERARNRLLKRPDTLLLAAPGAGPAGELIGEEALLMMTGSPEDAAAPARCLCLPVTGLEASALLEAARLLTGGGAADHCYRDLVECSPLGMVVTRRTRPVFANQAVADMLGYEGPQAVLAVGRMEEFVAAGEVERLRGYSSARERGESAPQSYDFEALRADGSHVWLQNDARALQWFGEPAVLNSLIDVTARKRAEQALRAERDRAQQYLDVAGVMLLALDTRGRVALINRRGCETLGHPEREILGRDWFDCFVPTTLARRLRDAFEEGLRRRALVAGYFENDVICRDGGRKTIAWHNTLLLDDDGEVVGTLSSGEDITRRRRAEVELERSRHRFRMLYDDNPAMFLSLGREGLILSANRFGAAQLGYRVEDLVGRAGERVFVEDTPGELRKRLDECFTGGAEVQRWECRMRASSGHQVWVRVTARLAREGGGEPVLLVVCEDITEAHRLSEQLSFQATHDALTGLVNRHEFEKRLARVIDSARSDDTEHALCYLDLDQFKVINDTCGHSAGDELLRQLAGLLPHRVRKRDTLARLGGDEFGALMEHCSLEQAKRVANGLRRTVADYRFVWEGKSFSVGVSIGVVPITAASERVSGVLAAADAACYAAKDRGRNRIHVYHPNDVDLAQRHGEMQWVSRLHGALERDDFALCFQPIQSVQPGEVQGLHYELLLRLPEGDGRVAPPGAFLPAAERYGLSPRIDRWVLESAIGWLSRHPAHISRLGMCSINLSGTSLGDEGFLAFLLGLLDSGRVPCNLLCFEVTETAAIANLSAAIRFITVLKELGCHFALDDFGSGVSSFAYLKSLPVDFLKIDGVFVKDILNDPIDLAMVRSINDIGHVMGKRTIAEFVENPRILAQLREIGVDYAQGYGIGRPRPMDELE